MKSYFISVPFFMIISGMVLHLVIPGIVALLFASLLVFLNGLGELWWIKRDVGLFIYLQAVGALVSSTVCGFTVAAMFRKIRSVLIYPGTVLFTLAAHFLFLSVFLGLYYLIYERWINFTSVRYSLMVTAVVAVILSIISILLKKASDVLDRK
jgi:hypothetical protein